MDQTTASVRGGGCSVSEPSRSPARRILVADGDPSRRHCYRDILSQSPETGSAGGLDRSPDAPRFEVDFASDGQEALAMVQRAIGEGWRYPLAFVDRRLSAGWDGLETVEQLWQVAPDMQVVVCTAEEHGSAEVRERLGATDHLLTLPAPLDSAAVGLCAHALVRKYDLQQEVDLHLAHLGQLIKDQTGALMAANARLEEEMVERERMQAELRLANKLEAVGQLAAGIAHEVNTPTQYVGDNLHFLQGVLAEMLDSLSVCRGVLSAAGEGRMERSMIDSAVRSLEEMDVDYVLEEVPRAMQQSIEGVEQISRIVRAMKEFSHPGSKEVVLTDINRSIESTVTVARNEWKYLAEMVLELDDDLPRVPCLPGEINQVILNLIVNAAHAIGAVQPEGSEALGRIVVTTGTADGNVWVRVADTGSGIPESVRDRVFDPFFTTKEVGKGTGQGLSMAHASIVDRHGGRIGFECPASGGTEFLVELPLERDDARTVSA